jgi:hypothetical protein
MLLKKKLNKHTIYVISCYSRLKTRFTFNYISCRANIYEYHYLECVRFQRLFATYNLKIDQAHIKYLIWIFGVHCEHMKAISVIKQKSYPCTPFTSYLVINVQKRVLILTVLHVKQTYTNIIILETVTFQAFI